MKKLTLTLLALAVLAGGVIFATDSNFSGSSGTYTNDEVGLSFEYPADWEIVSDGALSENRYKVYLKNNDVGGELVFEINVNFPSRRVGGFTLPEEEQSQYRKLTLQDGTSIWRPTGEVIDSTSTSRRLSRQPQQEALTFKDRHAFRFIFPELNQTNNVGETFDGGSGRLQRGSSTLAVAGGVQTGSGSRTQAVMRDIDEIVTSTSFWEGSGESFGTSTQSADTTDWQTYTNEEYNLSLAYPGDYHELSQEPVVGSEALMHLTASSSEAVLTADGYNRYPGLDIEIFPMSEYRYSVLSGGAHSYDPDQDRCVVRANGERSTSDFDISTDDWDGCEVGSGDAGYSNSGYFIPYEEEEIIFEVTQTAYFGTRRPLDFDSLVKTLEINGSQ